MATSSPTGVDSSWAPAAEKYISGLSPKQWLDANYAAINSDQFKGTPESGAYLFNVPGVGNVWEYSGNYQQQSTPGSINYIGAGPQAGAVKTSLTPRISNTDVSGAQQFLSRQGPKAGGQTYVRTPTGAFNLMGDLVQPLLVGVGGPLAGMAGAAAGLGGAGAAGGAAGAGAADAATLYGAEGLGGATLGSAGYGAGTGAAEAAAGGAAAAGAGNAFGVGAAEGSGAAAAGGSAGAGGGFAGLTGEQAANVGNFLNAGSQAGAAGASGGGVLDSIGSAAKGFLSSKLAIPAAATAVSAILGRQKVPESQNLKNEQALQGTALANAQSAAQGNITPSQKAQIDQWKTQQYESAKQFLINSGQGVDSSAWVEMKGKIDQGAIAMQQGFADQLYQQSMQMLGVSDAATQQLIQLRLQQQQQTGQALSSFLLAYGMMGGWGAS